QPPVGEQQGGDQQQHPAADKRAGLGRATATKAHHRQNACQQDEYARRPAETPLAGRTPVARCVSTRGGTSLPPTSLRVTALGNLPSEQLASGGLPQLASREK